MAKIRLEEEEELVTEEGDLGTSVGEEGPEEVRDLEGKSLPRMGILVHRLEGKAKRGEAKRGRESGRDELGRGKEGKMRARGLIDCLVEPSRGLNNIEREKHF